MEELFFTYLEKENWVLLNRWVLHTASVMATMCHAEWLCTYYVFRSGRSWYAWQMPNMTWALIEWRLAFFLICLWKVERKEDHSVMVELSSMIWRLEWVSEFFHSETPLHWPPRLGTTDLIYNNKSWAGSICTQSLMYCCTTCSHPAEQYGSHDQQHDCHDWICTHIHICT